MTEVSVHDYHRELICVYDDERYSVRDNGAVLRHPRAKCRPRRTDNQWTFGKPNSQNGYMYISQVRVHRIVATAFQGEPPTPEHVVDHIDTNRRNNRPDNLRWLTRLENALQNPITVKRIEFVCGSIEAFLLDPAILRQGPLTRNFEWMRAVSAEEAQVCLKRMHLWAKSDKPTSGEGFLGEWVYQPIPVSPPPRMAREGRGLPGIAATQPGWAGSTETSELVMAKTPGAAQRNWRVASVFPCCPDVNREQPLEAYMANLKVGAIFSTNQFSTHKVLAVAAIDGGQAICIMCESDGFPKPWSLAKVNFEAGLLVHESLGSFFSDEGAEKQFCLAQGLEWSGGDSIDDYC